MRLRLGFTVLALVLAGCRGSHHTVARWIAYSKLAPNDRYETWISRLDGSGKRRLASGVAGAVSPDGRWVAFDGHCSVDVNAECRDLYVVSTKGGKRRLLARGTVGATWSPDSKRIATDRPLSDLTDALVIVELESGKQVEITRGALNGWSFSPSGDEIVYAKAAKPSAWGIDRERIDVFAAPVDAGAPRQLTHDGRSGYPVWGPDAIAFARLIPYRGWRRDEIWRLRPDGHGLRRIAALPRRLLGSGFTGLQPIAWSRNGRELLAGLGNEFGGPPYAVDPRTGALRKLYEGLYPLAVALSADGRFVLVDENGRSESHPTRVVVVPYAGGHAQVIAKSAAGPSWNR